VGIFHSTEPQKLASDFWSQAFPEKKKAKELTKKEAMRWFSQMGIKVNVRK